MTKGPVAGNHPRAVKSYAMGGLIVTVMPDRETRYYGRQPVDYWLQINGETLGKIQYRSDRYTRGWELRNLIPHAVRWEGSNAEKYGRQGTEIPVDDRTWKGVLAAVPWAYAFGHLPTPTEVAAIIAEADAAIAAKKAKDEADQARWKAEREARAAAKEQRRVDTLEGLRSIRDGLGAALSNMERDALINAIVEFGGKADER